jgi:hypothetical protein
MLRLIAILLLLATPAFALETDCPLMDPENPGYRLTGGWPTYGVADGGDFVTEVKRGDYRHATEFPQPWDDRIGTFTCTYRGPKGEGRKIVLKIPGLMIRCDWLARNVLKPQPVEPGTGGPIEAVFLRIWCTSRP